MNYPVWGKDGIDPKSFEQMDEACALPVAVAGALMPDAHPGYGLPIGGVLALDNAVCPYAVGVDIACRMKLSVFEIPVADLDGHLDYYSGILERNTSFGIGSKNKFGFEHEVLDKLAASSVPPIVENRERAINQLGSSGTGNHFVEFGIVEIRDRTISGYVEDKKIQFVGLLSHSGSRGTGAQICNYYTKAAKQLRPEYGDLAWLDLGTDLGEQYWEAMNLMGEYAQANHNCIHRQIAKQLRQQPFYGIDNHHNFAWRELHSGREVIVHRKGATPAGEGALGIIPGSMGTPAFLVEGLGNVESLHSASHGAGRVMSRKQAKKTFDYKAEVAALKERGITVLSAGADEVVGVYKDIHQVMAAQTDLVKVRGVFHPKIFKMCHDGERAED